MTAPLAVPTLALVVFLSGVQAAPDEALLDAAQQNDHAGRGSSVV